MIRYSFFSFLSGLLFALGLSVSGMTEPGKVIGFLNITRSWNPSLVFVMGGAVITYFILFRLIHKRSAPLFALQFSIPNEKTLIFPFLEEQSCLGLDGESEVSARALLWLRFSQENRMFCSLQAV